MEPLELSHSNNSNEPTHQRIHRVNENDKKNNIGLELHNKKKNL
jgi:hypothetical protein